MSSDEFSYSLEFGLRLAKRISYATPPQRQTISKSSTPSTPPSAAVMLYAVIKDPSIVENPDIPSYQPYVHGRCSPPALIPLEMHQLSLRIDCFLDTAFITLHSVWRLHCVAASRRCDCQIHLPIHHQGSLQGVDVDVTNTSFATRMVMTGEEDSLTKQTTCGKISDDRLFLKHGIYTLTVPQIDGGSFIKVMATWSQKLNYERGGFFHLDLPFNFPAYVNPVTKRSDQREKIYLNVNCGPHVEVLCESASHPFKGVMRQAGKLELVYDYPVKSWSTSDFSFSYKVPSTDISCGVLLQSPPINDLNQTGMFCLYMLPGNIKVFRKGVIFIIDISGSMAGRPIDSVKNAVLAALSRLDKDDYFNIIAFNGDISVFSPEIVPVTEDAIKNANLWINKNFIAEGDTDLFRPINQALEMLAATSGMIPSIILATDGSVKDERKICDMLTDHLDKEGSASTRISTFGIGTYCNHYFLKTLAQLGRGQYDASYDSESIEFRLQRLIDAASSIILTNIKIETSTKIDNFEMFPTHIPDLTLNSPVIISGTYSGKFPDVIKLSGELADMKIFTRDLKVMPANDIPLDKVFARRNIDLLTASAWRSQDKQLEETVAKLSLHTGFPSEYTAMIMLQTNNEKPAPDVARSIKIIGNGEMSKIAAEFKGQKIINLKNIRIGFGDLAATDSNTAPGILPTKSSEPPMLVKAASNCCSTFLDRCCCMCFIQTMSKVNDQCAIALTQLCTALIKFSLFDFYLTYAPLSASETSVRLLLRGGGGKLFLHGR